VKHGTFGEGIVVACTAGSEAEVQVAFSGGAGIKRLLVAYARLERI
jgi:hypothetical protein